MIDLHVHTSCSDGDFTPMEIIELATNSGLKTLSITDHDTIKAYKTDIYTFAKQRGIFLIPGIEFSTVDLDSGEKIHVIGLNIDTYDNILNSLCDKLQESRKKALLTAEKMLKSCGIVLRSNNLLESNFIITKSHIARDVIDNPVNQFVLLDIYGKMPLYGTFIEDFLVKDKPAFMSNSGKLSTHEAIKVIKQAKGKAFCAHPSFNIMHGSSTFQSMKQLILRNKFDGIETINIQYDKSNGDVRFDMVKEFTDFAQQNNLLTSGGSDFHSNNRSLLGNYSTLGLANENYRVTEHQLAKIIAT